MQIAFAMPTKMPPKYCVVFVKLKLKIKCILFASVRYTMYFVRNTSTGICKLNILLRFWWIVTRKTQVKTFHFLYFMPVKKRDIYVLLKQTGYSPRIPVGSDVQRGMWPCVTTCYKEDPLSLSLSLWSYGRWHFSQLSQPVTPSGHWNARGSCDAPHWVCCLKYSTGSACIIALYLF